jgi:hypothetical protein
VSGLRPTIDRLQRLPECRLMGQMPGIPGLPPSSSLSDQRGFRSRLRCLRWLRRVSVLLV